MSGARKTADFARDGRIYLEALNRGELSPDEYHAMAGRDVDEHDLTVVRRWKKRKEMCEKAGLDVNMVFPPAPGTPVTAGMTNDQLDELIKNKEDDE